MLGRKTFLLSTGAIVGSAIAMHGSGAALAANGEGQMQASDVLAALKAGNHRYATDHSTNCNNNFDRRAEVSEAQQPHAIVLGCSDSRVPPEVVFDQRLGDMFTIRIAGNIADAPAIGSIEYAVAHFSSPLLVVLGHQNCGAVKATIEAIEKHQSLPGNIASIVAAIRPAVEPLIGKPGDVLDLAIHANIRAVIQHLKASSTILTDAVKSDKLRIVGGYYRLSDGVVEIPTA
ncbi:MAG: carbonic anhydrase [Candidatus Eremiobacteraeota bacterium]|nr:carbonic anhydrase [Candidatus Eremiobacteraeota bacterium]MBC5809162.1 carbonic anhydrase [Candidatus Eremiobacteraeota bacterium]